MYDIGMLTKKQKAVLDSIKAYILSHGIAPTIKELMDIAGKALGREISSERTIVQYLDQLVRKGFILRSGDRRGIRILDAISDNFQNVPILGVANAGDPLVYATENPMGYLKLSKREHRDKSGNRLFVVQIKGNSMDRVRIKGKHMEDGDFVLIDSSGKNPKNGDIVLAIIDSCATLKVFRKISEDEIGLFPYSTDHIHKPIYLHKDDDILVNGTVIDVFKNFEDPMSKT